MTTFESLPKCWTKIVGPQIASVTRPAAFNIVTGTLIVLVSSPQWGHELELITADLLASLPTIDGVRVRRIVWQRESAPVPRRPRRVTRR